MALKIGDRVQVVHCSGVDSGKEGVIISNREIPMKQTGGGIIPALEGHYRPMQTSEVGVRLDGGEIITMFRNRLKLMS
jgi:hypothetical protein